MEFHGDLNLEKFFLEWFGMHGRELGSNVKHSFGTHPKEFLESHRMYTDDPNTYLKFVKWCTENHHACWITSQPMRGYNNPLGIEKIFFDFDYHLKEDEKMTPSKKDKVKHMVLGFVEPMDYEPLIVETRKGYHVYVFLSRLYTFDEKNRDFATELFGVIGLSLLGFNKVYSQLKEEDRTKWKHLDFSPLGDIMRMARVPLTPHQLTGEICEIVNRQLKPTKIRSLDLYKAYGIREDKIREAVEIVKTYRQKKINDELKRLESGEKTFGSERNSFSGSMRPCFTERLKIGEMPHKQRLALLPEAWYSGYQTEEQLMDICAQFKDFNVKTSLTQVQWYLKNKAGKFPPWQCDTIESHGWCLKNECPIYRKRKGF